MTALGIVKAITRDSPDDPGSSVRIAPIGRFGKAEARVRGRDARAWMTGDDPGGLLRPAPEDSLREWIVSPRVNKAGVGDDDAALPARVAVRAATLSR